MAWRDLTRERFSRHRSLIGILLLVAVVILVLWAFFWTPARGSVRDHAQGLVEHAQHMGEIVSPLEDQAARRHH
jgi:hypothetical protein